MTEPYIGQICMFGFSFAPRNWAACNGQVMQISTNQALFSLLGNRYGGNGSTTFALPNLQGRAPIHYGQGPNLSPRNLAEAGGSTTVTLTVNHMPMHSHAAKPTAATTGNTLATPENNVFGADPNRNPVYSPVGNAMMKSYATDSIGGSQPFSNVQPIQSVNFCIALTGIFPTRD